MSLCVTCKNCEVASGKQKFCRQCAQKAGSTARRQRRLRLKSQGIPAWQRNGWTSVEQYRQYHRDYMRSQRERVHEMS